MSSWGTIYCEEYAQLRSWRRGTIHFKGGPFTPEQIIPGGTVTPKYIARGTNCSGVNGPGDHVLRGPVYFVTALWAIEYRLSNMGKYLSCCSMGNTIDNKRYTVCRFIVAAYYGMKKTLARAHPAGCARARVFQAELQAPVESVD